MFEGYVVEKKDKDLLIRAITKFGMKNQKIKAAKEIMELGAELIKAVQSEPNNVEEKIADVEIMLGQMRLIYNQHMINGYIEAKLERLKRKINNT